MKVVINTIGGREVILSEDEEKGIAILQCGDMRLDFEVKELVGAVEAMWPSLGV